MIDRIAPIALLALCACSSPMPPEKIGIKIDQAFLAAESLRVDGKIAGASEFMEAIRVIDPEDPRLPVEAAESRYQAHPWLGSNVARRDPCDGGFFFAILFYLPDCVLDLLDLVSFDVHGGPGAFVNAHVTRAFQIGAGARTVAGLGWHDHRSLGVQLQAESGICLPFFGTQAYAGKSAGTSGVIGTSDSQFGLHRPSQQIYHDYRDYWAIGAAATVVFVGADADIHVVDLGDFFAGLLTFDPLNDDLSSTCSVGLSDDDEDLLWELFELSDDRDSVDRYRSWKKQHRVDGAVPDPVDAPNGQ